jgi:hypothetical protein
MLDSHVAKQDEGHNSEELSESHHSREYDRAMT